MSENIELIRLKELCQLTTLKPSTIFKAMKQRTIPAPMKIFGKINVWKKQEILDWLNSQRAS